MCISDHFPVYSVFSMPDHNYTLYIHITKRIIIEDYNINAFRKKNTSKSLNWNSEFTNVEGVDNIFYLYMMMFEDFYNRHFPLKSF